MLWRDPVRANRNPTRSLHEAPPELTFDAPFEEAARERDDTARAIPWDAPGQTWTIEPLIQCLLEPHRLIWSCNPIRMHTTRLYSQGRPLCRPHLRAALARAVRLPITI